jgi:hypothetical protein
MMPSAYFVPAGLQARQQFHNNRLPSAPPPLSRDWIFEHDATRELAPTG